MHTIYIFIPKNPILRHCSETFFNVLKTKELEQKNRNLSVEYITQINLENSWKIIQELVTSQTEETSLFLLAVQSNYLVFACVLRLFYILFRKRLNIYYLMHEPRLEKGRVHFVKSSIIYAHQLVFANVADKVMLPSVEAVNRAKSFVPTEKFLPINLAFTSVSEKRLQKNLQNLKCQWNIYKNFLMLGTASSVDKNPQGFLDFAALFHQNYPDKGQFIRAGRDRNLQVTYDESLIVHFSNYISENTKGFLLGLAHFIVVPYTVSTQSGVIIEALSYGKLVIVNDIPAFAHLKGLNFVLVVDFSNSESILNCIHEILEMDVHDYEKCYWEAIRYFNDNYSERCLANAIKPITSHLFNDRV